MKEMGASSELTEISNELKEIGVSSELKEGFKKAIIKKCK
jgi:hypothetical protein